MSRECPQGGGSGRPMSCYNCNEEGHISRDCPKPREGGGRGGGRGGSRGGKLKSNIYLNYQ